MATGTNGQITQWQARRSDGWRGWKETNEEPVGATNAQAGDPNSSKKLTMCMELKTPNDSSIKTITSITVPMYVGESYNYGYGLYGIIRTSAPLSDGSETLSILATNTVSKEAVSYPAEGAYTEITEMTFEGTYSANTTYYLYFYTKTSSTTYRFEPYESANYPFSYEYTPRATYTISYDANGGSGAPSAQTKYEDIDLTLSSTKPSKSETTEVIKGSITITGYGNGGYFDNDTTKKSTSITGTSSRPDKTTYGFVKWNTASNGSGTDYSSGGTYKANSNVTLYAQYSKTVTQGNTTYSDNEVSRLKTPQKDNETPNTFTVKYDPRGGNSISNVSAPVTKKWTFGGWATSDNATSANAATSYNSNMDLYAYWTSTLSYTTITLPTPSRAGYTFQGWATNTTDTSGLKGGTKVEIKSNVTYYATWKPNGAVRIYIDGQGYRMAQVYLYANNKWNLTVPYLYNGSWKMSS